MVKIEVKDLYKVFGSKPSSAISLIKKGISKAEILKKTGCTVAINQASFKIEEGEIFVVMGLSGSGKSTMIRCFNRLIEPTVGQIFINGQDIMKMSKEELRDLRRYKMSMVFQHFGLLPHRTVLSNVEFGLEVGEIDKVERREKALKSLESVGLKGYENVKPDELSGGMQQRVGLARALANDPEILLMDEAFSALDPLIRAQMQDELLELQDNVQKTIVFITHDLDEALKIGDKIAILGPDGTVRQIGTPEEILRNPADDYVRNFIQAVDHTTVICASSIMRQPRTINIQKDGPRAAMNIMDRHNINKLFVIDNKRILKGLITIDDVTTLVKSGIDKVDSIINDQVFTTSPDTAIADLVGTAWEAKNPIAVIDDNYKLLGTVHRSAILSEVNINIDDEDSPTYLSEVIENDSSEGEV